MGDSRGLFDGFEHFRTAVDQDYVAGLRRGMVVPDANVLLNLYRYTPSAREDLFSILEQLRERLWVPHQVAVEFWRNRENAQRDAVKVSNGTVEALEKNFNNSANSIRAWANRTSVPKAVVDSVVGTLKHGFDGAYSEIRSRAGFDMNDGWRTDRDPTLSRLLTVLDGKVGPEPSADDLEVSMDEARRRIESSIPPGYMDKSKGGDRAYGDYIMWAETLSEARHRGLPVVLVTGDVKPDWWKTDEHNRPQGPRIELVAEMQREAGVELFFLRPEGLLRNAKEAFAVNIRDESVRDVKRIDLTSALGDEVSQVPDIWVRWQTLAEMIFNYSNFLQAQNFTVDWRMENGEASLFANVEGSYYLIKGYMPAREDHPERLVEVAREAQEALDREPESLFPVTSVILTVNGDSDFLPEEGEEESLVVEKFEDEFRLIVWPSGRDWYGSRVAHSAGLTSNDSTGFLDD